MTRKLNGYRGKLTPHQIAEGMNAAEANARRLIEDATILLKAKRFPAAASLAALAIEESGKVSILRGLALASTTEDLSQAWQAYRSHTKKNSAWLLPSLAIKGASRLEDFKPLFDGASEHPHLLDNVKQLGFYTDCLGSAHWSVPAEVVDEALAQGLVKTAQILTGENRSYAKEEIELWIEHIKPVWKRPPALMQEGLIRWYAAMQENGLAPRGPNVMEQFVREGIAKRTYPN